MDKANASMTEMKNGVEQLRNPIEILRDLAKTFNSLDEKDNQNYNVVVEPGKAYILGYELKIPTARRITVPKATWRCL